MKMTEICEIETVKIKCTPNATGVRVRYASTVPGRYTDANQRTIYGHFCDSRRKIHPPSGFKQIHCILFYRVFS